jgi:hypothetical protein
MAVRALSSAPAEHLEDLAYLLASLKADPHATAFAPDLEAASVALRTQNEDWANKHFAVRETQTGLGNVDETLINVVRTAHAVILDDLHHNRRSQRFLTYFPRGLVVFTRASYIDQLTAVRSLAQRCAQDPSPKVQEQAGLLQAAADQMDAAFARRGEALVAESVSYGQLQVQKLQAIDTCRRVGHRLAELYPEERDRVRSYFRKIYRRPRPTLPTAEEPAAATGTASTGTPAMETATTGTAPKAAPVGPTLVLTSADANL